MDNAFRVAVLGAGNIARSMAKTLSGMTTARAYAVASRDLEKSKAFAAEHGFEKAYGSYEEMLADPAVQLVYVATPHTLHYRHARMCLEAGKPVLCEKPFTVNAAQAEGLFALAREKGVAITEAIWPRYMPFFDTVRGLIDKGLIGEPRCLTATLGFDMMSVGRLLDPALAGGALMDLSVYLVNFAFMFFGADATRIAASCVKADTGVDAQNTIAIDFPCGRTASLFSTMTAFTPPTGCIYGDGGYIVLDNLYNPVSASIYATESMRLREVHYAPDKITGYEYEVEAMIAAVQSGAVECPQMPHAETLRVMKVLDGIRTDWGMDFPGTAEG